MTQRIKKIPDLERYAYKSRVAVAYLVGFVLLLAFSAGNAWSYAFHGASLPLADHSTLSSDRAQSYSPRESLNVPSSTNADHCLPLLKSIQPISSESALDRNQRTAGKIAALGLLFGVRLAPGPLERPGKAQAATNLQVKFSPDASTHNRAALSVVAYRKCRKQEALKELSRNHFRWSR
ncbi:MAG: hypothetical protein KDI90_05030 [Alphaproteobacteria bacterium]|nr:hypothetical protein [Alphaproteobacteria bacterium]MCB9975091.1 hypothetical protein [Rhodospirillales bacterium]